MKWWSGRWECSRMRARSGGGGGQRIAVSSPDCETKRIFLFWEKKEQRADRKWFHRKEWRILTGARALERIPVRSAAERGMMCGTCVGGAAHPKKRRKTLKLMGNIEIATSMTSSMYATRQRISRNRNEAQISLLLFFKYSHSFRFSICQSWIRDKLIENGLSSTLNLITLGRKKTNQSEEGSSARGSMRFLWIGWRRFFQAPSRPLIRRPRPHNVTHRVRLLRPPVGRCRPRPLFFSCPHRSERRPGPDPQLWPLVLGKYSCWRQGGGGGEWAESSRGNKRIGNGNSKWKNSKRTIKVLSVHFFWVNFFSDCFQSLLLPVRRGGLIETTEC